jgi:hypothetical protein
MSDLESLDILVVPDGSVAWTSWEFWGCGAEMGEK